MRLIFEARLPEAGLRAALRRAAAAAAMAARAERHAGGSGFAASGRRAGAVQDAEWGAGEKPPVSASSKIDEN